MSDSDFLTTFHLDGAARAVIGDSYDPGFDPDAFKPWCDVVITPLLLGADSQEIRITQQAPKHLLLFIPIPARLETGVLKLVRSPAAAHEIPDAGEYEEQEESIGVPLIAETPALELPEGVHLAYHVAFGEMKISGGRFRYDNFTFMAPTSATRIDIATVERINLPPTKGNDILVRMMPDDWDLDENGQLRFYANGIQLSGSHPLPATTWTSVGGKPAYIAAGATAAAARALIQAISTGEVGQVVEDAVIDALGSAANVLEAAEDAVDGALTEAGLLHGTRPLPFDPFSICFYTDGPNPQASWLAADLSGKPAPHSIAMIADALNIVGQITTKLSDAGVLTGARPIYDPDVALAFFAENFQRSDFELGHDGRFTDRVVKSIGDRQGLTGGMVAEVAATSGAVYISDTRSGVRKLLGTVVGAEAGSAALLDATTATVKTSSGPRVVSVSDPIPRRLFPTEAVAMWGNSLTWGLVGPGGSFPQANPTIPQTIAAELGVAAYNGGVGGQGSSEIAVRQGGLRPLVTLPSNQIPSGSSTPILLTAISPSTGWLSTATGSGAFDMHGTLAGVPGMLRHSRVTITEFYFVPDAVPVSTVAVPAGTPFIGDEGAPYRDRIQIFWAGHNSSNHPDAVVRDTASMVAHLTPHTKRFVVVSETSPSAYAHLMNGPLQAAYGENYADLRGHLIANGLALAGITPTSGDLADIAAGDVPRSLKWDATHFTQVAHNIIGHYLANFITAKHWIIGA